MRLPPVLAGTVRAVERCFTHRMRRCSASVERHHGAEVAERLRRGHPGVEHPLVHVHPITGRKGLYLSPLYARRIVGPAGADGRLLARPPHDARRAARADAVAVAPRRLRDLGRDIHLPPRPHRSPSAAARDAPLRHRRGMSAVVAEPTETAPTAAWWPAVAVVVSGLAVGIVTQIMQGVLPADLPRSRRLLDLSSPGPRGHAVQHHGKGRAVGGRHRRSGVRHR